jgi:hypothetical protein
LRFGKITPTDIDGALDFNGHIFIFLEAKFEGAELPDGQRLHLRNQCLSHVRGGAIAVALVLSHRTPPDDQIDFAHCVVSEVFADAKWRRPKEQLSCRMAIERLLAKHGAQYLTGDDDQASGEMLSAGELRWGIEG